MTNKQLIDFLSHQDPNVEVVVRCDQEVRWLTFYDIAGEANVTEFFDGSPVKPNAIVLYTD